MAATPKSCISKSILDRSEIRFHLTLNSSCVDSIKISYNVMMLFHLFRCPFWQKEMEWKGSTSWKSKDQTCRIFFLKRHIRDWLLKRSLSFALKVMIVYDLYINDIWTRNSVLVKTITRSLSIQWNILESSNLSW